MTPSPSGARNVAGLAPRVKECPREAFVLGLARQLDCSSSLALKAVYASKNHHKGALSRGLNLIAKVPLCVLNFVYFSDTPSLPYGTDGGSETLHQYHMVLWHPTTESHHIFLSLSHVRHGEEGVHSPLSLGFLETT